jgi:uncharacterized membrane protein
VRPRTHPSNARRRLGKAAAAGAVATYLARDPSLVPRTLDDQRLVTAGAALMGAAAATLGDVVAVALGRRVPGGRPGASALLTALGAIGWAWSSPREQRGVATNAVETASGVALVGVGAGEAGEAVLSALPAEARALVTVKALALGIGAGSAFRAVRRKVAEPKDLVKASIRYDFLPTASGGEDSLVPLATLDREGRKFLGLAVRGDAIAEVMGPGSRDPIRVYVGLESAPSPEERVRLAMAELERLGAFDRRRILVACPSGAGFVTPVPIEAEEYMTRGDIASVAIQYNNQRSHRSIDKVPVGVLTTRLLVQALRERLERAPADGRPDLVAYGESMGAWVAADVIVEGGLRLLDELDVRRAVLVGVPYRAAERLRRLAEAEADLPETLGVFKTAGELAALPAAEQERLRYALVTHPEDPVANFTEWRLLWERPTWLTKGPRRHPRVPRKMRWMPGITYLHVLFDVKNGTSFTADFEAYAHDYRLGLPALIRIVYGHGGEVSGEQLHEIEHRMAASARAQAQRERPGR